jgi:acetylornithine/succinyldiaminopimelate/putrescine aminotransferase
VVLAPHVAASMKPGDHGTTFGGGPLATRVGGVVLAKVQDTAFLARVVKMGRALRHGIEALVPLAHGRVVHSVRGYGLMLGVQMVGDIKVGKEATRFVELCHNRGLLVIAAGGNTVRIVPPLVISEEEVEKAVKIMIEVVEVMGEENVIKCEK